ncbi:MAG: HdeD family acid-resistance protein [Acidobacteria bacterium]|nr:HdeD family acid-resistance protein [Acidobacteriota bacterium]
MKNENKREAGEQMLVIRGVAAILFGILAFAVPQAAISILALIIGFYALVDGVFEIGYAVASKNWWRVIPGFLGIAVSVFVAYDPQMAARLIVLLVSAWMVVRGGLDINRAVKRRGSSAGERIGLVGGVLSIGVGVAIAILPDPGTKMIAWLLGSYALVYGTMSIADATSLGRKEAPTERAADRTPAVQK